MCASTPDKVEILAPPPGCLPGDRVLVEGITSNPDPVLNPKKKVSHRDIETEADSHHNSFEGV